MKTWQTGIITRQAGSTPAKDLPGERRAADGRAGNVAAGDNIRPARSDCGRDFERFGFPDDEWRSPARRIQYQPKIIWPAKRRGPTANGVCDAQDYRPLCLRFHGNAGMPLDRESHVRTEIQRV